MRQDVANSWAAEHNTEAGKKCKKMVDGDNTAVTPGNENAPLIAHIIYKLDVGGLENGLVNLINTMPVSKYRHAIICLTDYTDFRQRIQRDDVACYALNKKPGQDWMVFVRLFKLLKQLRPNIVHTRNLTALECQGVAALAGIPHRVHSEHGRDVTDIDGKNKKYTFLRRFFRPFIHRYIALSKDLEQWLFSHIKVDKQKLQQIYNGVDTDRFLERQGERSHYPDQFNDPNLVIVGTVGRMQPVKDQLTLVKAFVHLLEQNEHLKQTLRLALVGDGPLVGEIQTYLQDKGLQGYVWQAGSRNDIPDLMRGMDVFVLPSLNEGISNTILEAMASGLPVIATAVGGNPELVADNETGKLVPVRDVNALAAALAQYATDDALRAAHGHAARQRCETLFSLKSMVNSYMAAYDQLLKDSVLANSQSNQ